VTFIAIGYFLGEEWAWVSTKIHRPLAIGSGLVILLLLLYWVVQRKKSYGK
jgi:membrane protein DedA with SNARE-associated domain